MPLCLSSPKREGQIAMPREESPELSPMNDAILQQNPWPWMWWPKRAVVWNPWNPIACRFDRKVPLPFLEKGRQLSIQKYPTASRGPRSRSHRFEKTDVFRLECGGQCRQTGRFHAREPGTGRRVQTGGFVSPVKSSV